MINVDAWLPKYLLNRYGTGNTHALKAWDILRKTVYTVPVDKYKRDGSESIIQARPTFDSSSRWANTKLNYDAKDLLPAWDEMIKAIPACKKSDGFQYDLVDITRQVMANYASRVHEKFTEAYRNRSTTEFTKTSQQFIQLIEDMDRLLATRKDFMLGPWVASARKWGVNEKEKALYELNAKDLITLWGDKDCPLNEYACRQWSGLLDDFYKPRWEQFFVKASTALGEGKEMDKDSFVKGIKDWEWQWVNKRKDYPVTTIGKPVDMVEKIYEKYHAVIEVAY